MNIDVMGAEDRLSKAWQTLSGLITETAHHTASLKQSPYKTRSVRVLLLFRSVFAM